MEKGMSDWIIGSLSYMLSSILLALVHCLPADGSSIPDTDNVPPEVTTLAPGGGGQCDASRALRKLKVCQSFMARVQEKGQREFCR